MRVVETLSELFALRREWDAHTVCLVPTMGALHQGHLSLIEKAKTIGERVIVSIFVNPMQFGPTEDFSRYPRPRERDLMLCEEHAVDAVFSPQAQELYPHGLDGMTQVVPPSQLVNQLCGAARPGHFTGVATIVLKLFQLTRPTAAVFGEKDAQQLAVIKRMVADLNLPVAIIPVSTVRESDGLALSSRNQYLNRHSDRRQARLLSRILMQIQEFYQQGIETTEDAIRLTLDKVLDEALYPDFELEYVEAVDNETFLPTEILDDNTRIVIAGKVGDVRLIDNTLISSPILLEPTFHPAEKLPV